MAEENKAEVHPDFNKKSSTNMDPKMAVLISHIGFIVGAGWLSGLIIYILEKENYFVKFHAMQSLIIGIAEVIGYIIGAILTMVIIGVACFPIVWVAALIIRIIIVMKANQGELYKFPWLGNMAEKYTKM
ncbi:MAG: DUF4870 domain-containing protein [Actinomycetota bacterium]|nr:DUF4870 domain-containing protein [Actinomycetota bacterium]